MSERHRQRGAAPRLPTAAKNSSKSWSAPPSDHPHQARPSDPRVDQIEVLLPGLVIVRDLPRPLDALLVLAEGACEALRELERREIGLRPLQLPDALVEFHLVDARDSALVEVVLEE